MKSILTILTLACLGANAQETGQLQYSNLQLDVETVLSIPMVKVIFDVTNKGNKTASETPRIHYQSPKCPIAEALGVARTVRIAPGGTATMKIPMKQYDLAIFDKKQKARILMKGQHRFVIRNSLNENQLNATFDLAIDKPFSFEKGFSGLVYSQWRGERNMTLDSTLVYTDSEGKRWTVPRGATINGATIPRYLWRQVGSPFVGPYRRASVVHDYHIGENDNPAPIDMRAMKAADRMFYEACRTDGCSVEKAATLYLGVRFGSWLRTSKSKYMIKSNVISINLQDGQLDEKAEEKEFKKLLKKLGPAVRRGDLDKIDAALAAVE